MPQPAFSSQRPILRRALRCIVPPATRFLGFRPGIAFCLYSDQRERNNRERYVLNRELDLETSYFFGPDEMTKHPTNPAIGTLSQGTELKVEGRHSSACYVIFRTVVDVDVLREHAQPTPPGLHRP